MIYRITFTCISLLLMSFAYLPAEAGSPGKRNKSEKDHPSKSIVYVCACLNNKSCSCMTEAKMQGPLCMRDARRTTSEAGPGRQRLG
jgi:hypothetical protein